MEKASPGRVSEKSRNLPGKTRREASGDRAVGELAFEGFGGGRLAILEAVADDELRYTDLTRRLSASEGEVSRNLARLVRAGRLEDLAAAHLLADPLEIGEATAKAFSGAGREFRALWVIGRAAVVQDRIEMTAPFRSAVGRGDLRARCVVLEDEAPLLRGFGDP